MSVDGENEKSKLETLNVVIERSSIYSKFLADILEKNTDGSDSKEREEFSQPSIFAGTLRDYQIKGVQWLISLWENALNGILADEMGLGKTIQTISLIAYLWEKGVKGPFLIVAPLSTIANWEAEFKKFAPTIPTCVYHGDIGERNQLRKRFEKKKKACPVVITSYDIAMNDRKYLQKTVWKYLVVDEGHRLKNYKCKLFRELKSLNSDNRLLITGTPLQNNLSELWSLLNFLLPDVFNDLQSFQSWYFYLLVFYRFDFENKENEEIISQEEENSIVSKLHSVLKPFLLRRLKSDVEVEMPKKKEYLVLAPMTMKQKEYYDAILNKDLRELIQSERDKPENDILDIELYFGDNDSEAKPNKRRKRGRMSHQHLIISDDESKENEPILDKSKRNPLSSLLEVKNLKLQNRIVQLRKICDHPYLFDIPEDENGEVVIDERLVMSSGKMLLLDQILKELFKQEGHKVLIFSQMTKMLDLLEEFCNLRNFDFCRIDGTISQKERQSEINEFNNPDSSKRIFLLSTRSGGLGINLTSADTVIIFDSDWNPQMDLQAQDRAHRIGQTKPVLVFRFAIARSIEHHIIETASSKRKLEKVVIESGRFKGDHLFRPKQTSLGELAQILAAEDNEKLVIQKGDRDIRQVLSEEELRRLLDRSDESMSNMCKGEGFLTLEEAMYK
ncbi:hypothetical protein ROZALSC1DRAFT_28963 [Rozella allomycis CSF55]|uniref:Helicase, superfamily 1/2, ATP-binding domain-containing protein n=1 Tax=Rozella allomycis (strain CSF55) TaxID=988480 RepID=A0A075AU86_ROZAC|nr:Helicase, superfamily 1/2, ATP-binding domain-containing protein [Rozella allomycis CSF55]RKP19433.1 hypothetical protein ROZALSC1DRAFT_28963 [Rozella allomycis CSF55]|eukprot:EPZ33866.1 Helicase, superfamily 1/2, ATP-binding domain-containing protein [Rozella allomycis CSF55]